MRNHVILLVLVTLQMVSSMGGTNKFWQVEHTTSDEIQPRLNPKSRPNIILVWTERDRYALNDIIKIVVESSNENLFSLKINTSLYGNMIEPLRTEFKTIVENGKTHRYNIYYFKAIGSGSVVIESYLLSIIHKKQIVNGIHFTID